MAALNFPSTPTNGQKWTDPNGQTWTYETAPNSWTADGAPVPGMVYKGGVNITAAAPTGAQGGWVYTVTTGGTPHASFTGLTGTIAAQTQIIFDGTNWQTQSPPGIWSRTGTVVSPTNAGDSIATQDGSVKLAPGTTGSPLVRDSQGRLLVGTSSTTVVCRQVLQGSSGGLQGAIQLFAANTATPADRSALGGLYFADSTHASGAYVFARRDGGTWSTSSLPTRLEISTCPDGSTTPVERLRISGSGVVTIGNHGAGGNDPVAVSLDPGTPGSPLVRDSSGRVGIGATAPSENLVINDGAASVAAMLRTGGATSNAVIKFNADDTNYAGVGIENAALVFRCSNSATPVERMRIGSNGTVTASSTVLSPRFRVSDGGVDKAAGMEWSSGYSGLSISANGARVIVQSTSAGSTGVILEPSATSWTALTSESRLKDIIGDVDEQQAWDLVRDIQLKRYYYSDQEDKTGVSYAGPMADWLGQQDPELLIDTGRSDDDGPIHTYNQGLLDMKALAALSAALKRIEALEAQVAALTPGGSPEG